MTRNKKIALATLPALALVVLGSSVASAHMRTPHELTEEQQSALLEARELRKEGSGEEARRVLKEAGIAPHMTHMFKRGGVGWIKEEREQRHEALHEALEHKDFEAFKKATADAPFASMVTEENFAKLVEAHELRKAGDHEGALQLLQELGFPGKGRGMWQEGR